MDEAQRDSRIVYPKLPEILTEGDLERLFTFSLEEHHWALTVSRRGPSTIALLTHLKVFQTIGRFLGLSELPRAGISRVAKQLYLPDSTTLIHDRRTLYRHHSAIRDYLKITPWGVKARGVAAAAIAQTAEGRIDPADLINAAIDALIRERCELPLLSTLRTLAGTALRLVNAAQWQQVYERVSAQNIQGLDVLLTANTETQESPFAVMCRGAGKATRDNLKALIAHYQWLESLVNPIPLLAPISEAKVAQWANEAERLKARELREYVPARRYTLLLAALRAARGRRLDDLAVMLIKFSGKIVWRSEQYAEESQGHHREQTDELIATLADILTIFGGAGRPKEKLAQVESAVAAGGAAALLQACAAHTKRTREKWQPYAHQAFSYYRNDLLQLARTLPLKAARDSANSLVKAVINVTLEPSTCDYYCISDLKRDFIPPSWRALIDDREDEPHSFNRRHLEVLTILELAEAIKTGAIYVTGSLSYDDFWGRLPIDASDPERMAAYAVERSWPAGAAGFTGHLYRAISLRAKRNNSTSEWACVGQSSWISSAVRLSAGFGASSYRFRSTKPSVKSLRRCRSARSWRRLRIPPIGPTGRAISDCPRSSARRSRMCMIGIWSPPSPTAVGWDPRRRRVILAAKSRRRT